mmetsp:Transcript_25351/g.31238  ORF Transcript_25351/g.31238 Transcript_25351/m.31238 type:complete len:333 (+) Transcript_25351:89-1087(+)
MSKSTANEISHDETTDLPLQGMRTIQRNRRGPMTRLNKNRLRRSFYQSARSKDRYYNSDDSRTIQQGYPQHSITTHIDYDDREILIESSLGNNEYNYHISADGQLLETSDLSGMYNSRIRNHGSKKNSYSPMEGYDPLSEEEHNTYYQPPAVVIFEMPKFIKENRTIFLKVVIFLLGILVYILINTLFLKSNMQRYYENHNSQDAKQTYETSVDLEKIIRDNVFNFRGSEINKDETMDVGFNDHNDDMAFSVVEKSISQQQNRTKSSNSTSEGIQLEDINDDYIVGDTADSVTEPQDQHIQNNEEEGNLNSAVDQMNRKTLAQKDKIDSEKI